MPIWAFNGLKVFSILDLLILKTYTTLNSCYYNIINSIDNFNRKEVYIHGRK